MTCLFRVWGLTKPILADTVFSFEAYMCRFLADTFSLVFSLGLTCAGFSPSALEKSRVGLLTYTEVKKLIKKKSGGKMKRPRSASWCYTVKRSS